MIEQLRKLKNYKKKNKTLDAKKNMTHYSGKMSKYHINEVMKGKLTLKERRTASRGALLLKKVLDLDLLLSVCCCLTS